MSKLGKAMLLLATLAIIIGCGGIDSATTTTEMVPYVAMMGFGAIIWALFCYINCG